MSQSTYKKQTGLAPRGTESESGSTNSGVNESAIVRSVRTTLARLKNEAGATPRPAVTLAFAQSLDGCITASKGSSTAISSDQSMLMTHQLRAMHDAILIGFNTVLVDDPRLTVRHTDGDNPVPVVLDSRLRTPPTARLLQQDNQQAIIATLPDASKEREMKLVEAGARVIRIAESPGGGIQLSDLFSWLRGQNVKTLMIEGGAQVICSVLANRLADQLVLTIAPRFFGQSGVRAAETLNCAKAISRPCLTNIEIEQLGDDLLIRGNMSYDDIDPVNQ